MKSEKEPERRLELFWASEEVGNVPYVAALFDIPISIVKSKFPLEDPARVAITGIKDGGHFAVCLVRDQSEEKLLASINSSHGYEKCIHDCSIKERNKHYLAMLDKRPEDSIKSENSIRQSKLSSSGNAPKDSDIKTTIKREIRDVKKTNGLPESKEPVKKVTSDTVEPKSHKSDEVKTEDVGKSESSMRSGSRKKEKAIEKETKQLPSAIGSKKKEDKTEEKRSPLETTPKSKVAAKTSEVAETQSKNSRGQKRKTEEDTNAIEKEESDEEVDRRKNQRSKRKKRAVIESDSEEEKKEAKTTPKAKSTRNVLMTKDNTPQEKSTEPVKKQVSPRLKNGKRRRRVLKEVTHTFKTEDGFLETKIVKEMVSETDTDDEAEVKSKNTVKKNIKTPLQPAPRGQSSISSFFKKQ